MKENLDVLSEETVKFLKNIKNVAMWILGKKIETEESLKDKGLAIGIIIMLLLSMVVSISLIISSIAINIINQNTKRISSLKEIQKDSGVIIENEEAGRNIEPEGDINFNSGSIKNSITENLEDNESMYIVLDESGDKVPVPRGFVASSVDGEKEIDTGFVIYEGEDSVTDENVETAKKTRNQYVWIPVTDPSEMYGIDSNGKMWGKLYDFSSEGITNLNWSETNGVMKISFSASYREPDILIEYETDSKIMELGLESQTRMEWQMQINKDFREMIKSIEKYGGFYCRKI